MVFEYMNHDLTGLLDTQGVKLNPAQIKCYMKQLLEGVCYMHKNKILHRDIKGALAALRLPWLPPGCLVLPRRPFLPVLVLMVSSRVSGQGQICCWITQGC